MDNCPECGYKLDDTSHGRKHCPNHGIIESSEEVDTESERSYIN